MSDGQLLLRTARNGWRYKWLIGGFMLATAATGAMWAYLFKALGPFIGVLGRQAGDASAQAAAATLQGLGLEMLAIAPLAALGAYLSWLLGQLVANRATRDLRDRVLTHIVTLELAWHHQLTRGDMLARLTNDLGSVLKIQQYLYGKLLQRPLQTVGILIGVFIVDWRVALAVSACLVPVGFALAPVVRRTRRRSKEARAKLVENLGVLEQITAGIRVIKAMGSSAREADRYAAHNGKLFRATMQVARARATSDAITYGSIFLLGAGAMIGGGWLWSQQLLTLEKLVLGLGALGFLVTGLRETVRAWGDLQELLPSAERVYAVLDRAPAIADGPGVMPAPRSAIRLEGVRFRYAPDAGDVLRGIDLELPAGRTTALVGASGGGKSTVLDLVARFHDPQHGRVTWDGVDVRSVTTASLASHLAIVAQDSFLFDDTILANIAYGRPEATRAEVEQAARRANLHDDILRLEGGLGYDTPVGDRGGRLSGGQRQRVAIARALLRDAPVLLLDEPTSALDAGSEEMVQLALRELMHGRTVVIVAHRLATVRHADRIVVVAGKDDPQPGTVLESGRHDELIARGGRYAELIRLQGVA